MMWKNGTCHHCHVYLNCTKNVLFPILRAFLYLLKAHGARFSWFFMGIFHKSKPFMKACLCELACVGYGSDLLSGERCAGVCAWEYEIQHFRLVKCGYTVGIFLQQKSAMPLMYWKHLSYEVLTFLLHTKDVGTLIKLILFDLCFDVVCCSWL